MGAENNNHIVRNVIQFIDKNSSTFTEVSNNSPPKGERSEGFICICFILLQILVENDLLKKAGDDVNISGLISARISQKDKMISRQLNYILHHDDFQTMEASWRGLNYLVTNTETSSDLKLKLLNISYDDLYKDLDKAVAGWMKSEMQYLQTLMKKLDKQRKKAMERARRAEEGND